MTARTKSLVAIVGGACVAALMVVQAQEPGQGEAPRTSWGAPDLRGTWDFRTITPFERPASFADREFLTPDEVEEFEAAVRESRAASAASDEYTESQSDVDVGYNSFFIDSGTQMSGTMRTSLVVYPPDGRVPAMTEDARARARQRFDTWGSPPRTPADRNTAVRCITGFNSGPPMAPGAYNNIMEVFQTEDHVAIRTEMVNDHRIIPVDDRPPLLEELRLWKGDSRGHWEEDTFVVTTTNFTADTAFRNTGRDLVLTERFTRTSEDGLLYEYTVDDPASYEDRWSTALEMRKTDDLIYEYACHEGNLAMMLMLRGARLQEAEGRGDDQWLATWYRGASAAVRDVDADDAEPDDDDGEHAEPDEDDAEHEGRDDDHR